MGEEVAITGSPPIPGAHPGSFCSGGLRPGSVRWEVATLAGVARARWATWEGMVVVRVARAGVLRMAVAGAVAVVLPLAVGAPSRGSFPGTNGGFVLVESGGGQTSLVLTNREGVTVRRLAECPHDYCFRTPDWSPTGAWVTYVRSASSERSQVIIVRADGTGSRTLRRRGHSSYPVWSPNGHRIAFVNAETGYIATMRSDGTDVQRVLNLSDVSWGGEIFGLDWSSRNRLVLTDWQGVFTVHPDGTNLRLLAPSGRRTVPVDPSWSPSGRWLVYYRASSTDSGGGGVDSNGDIFTMRADGRSSGHYSLGVTGSDPCWAPDGSHIAYFAGPASGRTGVLHTVVTDGTGDTVVGTPVLVSGLDWRPR